MFWLSRPSGKKAKIIARNLVCVLIFLNGVRIKTHIDIDPHQAGNPEDVHEINYHKANQHCPSGILRKPESPEKNTHKQEAKPGGPNIGNKHGAEIIPRLGVIVQIAFGATLPHIERFFKRPTARFKHGFFLTAWALQVKNTVGFAPFF
jgi:hypothetical protein